MFNLIEKLANEAIELAKQRKNEFKHDPINWYRVECGRILKCEDQFGLMFYRIEIYGAAYGCDNLCRFIMNYITKNILEKVFIEVVSEW